MNRPDLMLVACLIGKAPEDDPRLVSCITDDNLITTIVLRDAAPDSFRHVSAEFLDGWTWQFDGSNMGSETTTIILDRKKRRANLSGGVCCINNLPLIVKEVRTVGLPCADTRPMIMTEAGVFMLHPQLRAKTGDRLVCSVGSGVVYLSTEKEIPSVQISFGQHWGASQAEIITTLWNANH